MQNDNSAQRRPKYRMIAIDMDGTLLSPQGQVTQQTKEAIHRTLSAGLLICFATGRNWTESKAVLDAVAHYDTAVFVGGAMVVDTRQGVTLHRTKMQPALAAQVCEFFENLKHPVMALQDLGEADVGYLISGGIALDPATRRWLEITRAAVKEVASLANHPHEHTIRVGICATRPEASEALMGLEKAFGDRIICHSVGVIGQEMEILEVFDPAVNKWEGVMHVARRHGIEADQIIAIGDDRNDLPMITRAGLGVAMGNSHPQVLAVAKRVIGTNAEDGLAQFLDELVQEHKVAPLEETAGQN